MQHKNSPQPTARLSVSGPSITQKEIDYVTDAVSRCWYSEANDYHDRFEAAFAAYHNVQHAVALPSCTSAIHLSLLALGIGPGDEVIVPDVTWIASAAPISYVGARAIFADIDEHTWCLSAEAFEAAITSRTKAVLPVGLYGNLPDMQQIRRIADEHGLAIIEDAAEAVGSEQHGQKAGSFGDTGVFSFHGSKTMTTGEGGMLITDRKDIFERVLFLRDHGRKPGDKMFWNSEVGCKYKMSSMQAALGLAQLERLDELVQRKRRIFSWYQQALGGDDRITLNCEQLGTKNTYWMVTAVVDESLRLGKEELIGLLSAEGIDSRPFFYPLSSLPAFADNPYAERARRENHISYSISPRGVNLPCGMNVTQPDVQRVARVLNMILTQRGGSRRRSSRAA